MLESFTRSVGRLSGKSSGHFVVKSPNSTTKTNFVGGLNRSLSKQPIGKLFPVTIIFLDESSKTFNIDKLENGSRLLQQVFQHLDLTSDQDYFGLVYNDSGGVFNSQSVYKWLDMPKSVRQQIKHFVKVNKSDRRYAQLFFRVKFYATDPSSFKNENTRYQFYLQLKQDLCDKRLICNSSSTLFLLASYILQATSGDYDDTKGDSNGFVSRTLPPELYRQCFEVDASGKRISEIHKLHRGQGPSEAEFYFLDTIKRLEMYGAHIYLASDTHDRLVQLGVSCVGLLVFKNGDKIGTFCWSKIVKISFKRKQFFIQLRKEVGGGDPSVLGFNLSSYRSCKSLWKSAIEHHLFFRLYSKTSSPLGTGSKLLFNKRLTFQRNAYSRQTLPASMKLDNLVARLASPETSSIGSSDNLPPRYAPSLLMSRDGAESVNGSTSSLAHRAFESFSNKVQSFSSHKIPKRAWTLKEDKHEQGEGFLDVLTKCSTPSLALDATVDEMHDGENKFSNLFLRIAFVDDSISSDGTNASQNGTCSSNVDVERVVLTADGGRFGFNVKGGKDSNTPIVISRVAHDSPASNCQPPLCEGDHLIFINDNFNIEDLTHEQIVQAIRASGQTLVLGIKKINIPEVDESEPNVLYVPQITIDNRPNSISPELHMSMQLLSDLLEDDKGSIALSAQFTSLERYNHSMNMVEPGNLIGKNRYRDILPYEETRVILKSIENDYINASHIVMHIPGSNVVNRYIATQGPLSSTCLDFWLMTLQNKVDLIVMLTTIVEGGRIKCHKYWPDLHETLNFDSPELSVVCTHEHFDFFTIRKFEIRHNHQSTHQVTQMCYPAWPDHGTPEDLNQFIHFVYTMRQLRNSPPVIVHCSAGIGRTGVAILMETAVCLIEANRAVYPLELTKRLRDQRVNMVQTFSQYEFVCKAILTVYNSGKVRPLPSFYYIPK